MNFNFAKMLLACFISETFQYASPILKGRASGYSALPAQADELAKGVGFVGTGEAATISHEDMTVTL